ncbi:MAG TPA: sugar phosphate isomerase/epimerase family protein [Armatimonadota bacterium]|nr:sugar phosphate isomerase/epimerase family protein [Armatimonadota bacterium]
MFKLSVISDEISQDFQRVVDVCQEYDVPMVEPRSVWEKAPQDLTDDDVAKMKQILDAAGMSVSAIAAPFFKCDLGDADQYAEHMGILRRCIQIGQTLDCKIIRGFTFWKTGPAESVWQQLLDAYQEPIAILEAEDCYVGIENEASTHIATAAEAEAMYKDLASPRVQAIWDPANEVYADDGELPFPDAFERMKPNLIHVHIKDAVRDENGEPHCVPVGDGGYIDYPGQFQALIDMGYEGACSLETHWRPSSELDEDLLNQPGGAAFSAAGEPASRICLDNIKAIIAGLKM